MRKVIETNSPEATEAVAERIGAKLRGGETIELSSDVGGGKTTFTRGLARGAGSKDNVSSPTFTISNKYSAKKFTIWHFDFYRLNEAGLIEHELDEVVDDEEAVIVVEWSEIVNHVLPQKRLTIKLVSGGEMSRRLEFTCPDELNYLLEDVDIND